MEVIQSGVGELIQPLDVNAFREWNRAKPKSLFDKRMTEAEAVSRFVRNGDYIGTELYGTVRCPMSLINEIVRQGITDLRVAGQGVFELDMLLAAGRVKALDVTYIGLEVYGVSNCLRREVESGRVETCVEWSNAANLVTIFEFGGTGAILEKLPLAVGGECTFHRAVAASGICDIVETAQRGFIEYGFLGGAQIDPYGNLNSTVIGDYYQPKVRLPGSGGANDVGSHCWQTIAIMRHDKRRFVKKVDFVTTPGYLSGPGAREAAGLPPGTGPYRVVSNLAVLGYHTESKRMILLATQPGISIEQVAANTGFELLIAEDVEENSPPTAEELQILREEVDPDHLYI